MSMRWHDLLFAHWPVEPAAIRSLIPASLDLETWEGQAWLGIVPFWMSHVRARWLAPVPGISRFPEINVRTYVTAGGKPGVWFFSLDATSSLAVRAARWSYNIPYYVADIQVERGGDDSVQYHARRKGNTHRRHEFSASYRPTSCPAESAAGTLQHWFTERYCLYSAKAGQLWRIDIDHAPWQVQSAACELHCNTMDEPLHLKLPTNCPQLHFARRQVAVAWLGERV